jgi:glyoxylate reductase
VISTASVGFEHIDVEEATKRGIYVGYAPAVLTDATADLAFALLLAAGRRIAEADGFVRALKWKVAWTPTAFLGASVWGKTLGIVGLGRIGQALARRAKGFNMNILYTDTTRHPVEVEQELSADFMTLEDLLKQSDFVSIHVPLTKDTHHLINENRLRLMKRESILVNTSRGPVVDEQALFRVLKEKAIAAAGIDVFAKEPIEASNPLLTLDNIVLLPHIGSATKEARRGMGEAAARNLLAVLRGEPPVYWLNPEVEKVRPLTDVRMI